MCCFDGCSYVCMDPVPSEAGELVLHFFGKIHSAGDHIVPPELGSCMPLLIIK